MGTGSATAELIAKYQQLNPEVEPNDILLPRKLRYAPAAWHVLTRKIARGCNSSYRHDKAEFRCHSIPPVHVQQQTNLLCLLHHLISP